MKTKFLAIALLFLLFSCDIYKPQKKFRLAVPQDDYFYNYMATHVEPFLENHGYQIDLINAPSAIAANRMVADGEADICFINNHSVPVSEAIGTESGKLRSVLPLTTRLFFAFTKDPLPDSATARELFENKKIGIELLNGEAQLNLEQFMASAKIKGTQLVTFHDNPDVIVFWGTFFGTRAAKYLAEGWHPFSFNQNWIEFLTMNDPALRPFTLPSIPGEKKSIRLNTMATETILVANKSIGENSIYKLAEVIYQNKLDLMNKDLMYRSIHESFDQVSLLYPLHPGTNSYLQRQQPVFFIRYSNELGLTFSISAMLFGIIQGIRTRLAKRRKDRINIYFIDFLEIRSTKELSLDQKVKKLDTLFQRAVEQMANDKLDKSDFHILSRLIQQEVSLQRYNS